jgi:ubiquinone/menaquinone biosynthesis C-methylase UbiE
MRSPSNISTIARKFLQFFFHHLYHRFAWSYDLVAWLVSQGQWIEWVTSAVEFLDIEHQSAILELGHGPGYLQSELNKYDVLTVGLDESIWMSKLAKKRLTRQGFKPRLINGLAERLPFDNASFTDIIATFPSEYIFSQPTIQEINRVLAPGGSLVILPFAWFTGGNLNARFGAWLFRVTGQSPADTDDTVDQKMQAIFQEFGFDTVSRTAKLDNSLVYIIIARKLESES